MKAYNAIHTYDKICLSETYLNRETLFGNDNLRIAGYELIRVDHPSNQKQGFSPNKSKQSKLIEGKFKFQCECRWERVSCYLDLL